MKALPFLAPPPPPARRPAGSSHTEMMQTLVLGSMFAGWYAANIAFNIYNKQVLARPTSQLTSPASQPLSHTPTGAPGHLENPPQQALTNPLFLFPCTCTAAQGVCLPAHHHGGAVPGGQLRDAGGVGQRPAAGAQDHMEHRECVGFVGVGWVGMECGGGGRSVLCVVGCGVWDVQWWSLSQVNNLSDVTRCDVMLKLL